MSAEKPYGRQKDIWDREHSNPELIHQLDTAGVARGVTKFWDWLSTKKDTGSLKGIEIGCGKGRNVNWLAEQGVDMTGIDFSPSAISEARTRADTRNLQNAHFFVHDVTQPLHHKEDQYDFAVDCFATAAIENIIGRKNAAKELTSIVKPEGHILVYTLSTDDAYYQEMVKKNPGDELHTFIHPVNLSFEKSFTRAELLDLYAGLNLAAEDRIERTPVYTDKAYPALHHWMIFQKPKLV